METIESCKGENVGTSVLYDYWKSVNKKLNEVEQCEMSKATVRKVRKAGLPPSGYRFIYVDEVNNNAAMMSAVLRVMSFLERAYLVNGWIKDLLGGDVTKDCGDRTGIYYVMVVSECLPIQM